MIIEGRPVVHMVDKSMHFCSAAVLRNRLTAGLMNIVQNMSLVVYFVPWTTLLWIPVWHKLQWN